MIDRRAWESACPSNCKKLGMSAALDEWARVCIEPRNLNSYDAFVEVRAAALDLETAISAVEKKLDRAEEDAWALLKNAKTFRENYLRKLTTEYQRRIAAAVAIVDDADQILQDQVEKLERDFETARQQTSEIETFTREFDTNESDEILERIVQSMLELLKQSKSDAKNDFVNVRKRLTDHDVRLRGLGGICDDLAIGGEEKQQLAKRFSEHMKKFQKAEQLCDRVIVTMREAVVAAKNLATLADNTVKDVNKHKQILETVQASLVKVYALTHEVRSKRTNIDGLGDARKDPAWPSALNVEEVRNEMKYVNDIVSNAKGYIEQVRTLEGKAVTIVDKATNGIPQAVANRHRIRKARKVITDALATEQRTNAEQIDTWNNVIQRGASYLNRLKQREKELAI